jgi:hypothetical protein
VAPLPAPLAPPCAPLLLLAVVAPDPEAALLDVDPPPDPAALDTVEPVEAASPLEAACAPELADAAPEAESAAVSRLTSEPHATNVDAQAMTSEVRALRWIWSACRIGNVG